MCAGLFPWCLTSENCTALKSCCHVRYVEMMFEIASEGVDVPLRARKTSSESH